MEKIIQNASHREKSNGKYDSENKQYKSMRRLGRSLTGVIKGEEKVCEELVSKNISNIFKKITVLISGN